MAMFSTATPGMATAHHGDTPHDGDTPHHGDMPSMPSTAAFPFPDRRATGMRGLRACAGSGAGATSRRRLRAERLRPACGRRGLRLCGLRGRTATGRRGLRAGVACGRVRSAGRRRLRAGV